MVFLKGMAWSRDPLSKRHLDRTLSGVSRDYLHAWLLPNSLVQRHRCGRDEGDASQGPAVMHCRGVDGGSDEAEDSATDMTQRVSSSGKERGLRAVGAWVLRRDWRTAHAAESLGAFLDGITNPSAQEAFAAAAPVERLGDVMQARRRLGAAASNDTAPVAEERLGTAPRRSLLAAAPPMYFAFNTTSCSCRRVEWKTAYSSETACKLAKCTPVPVPTAPKGPILSAGDGQTFGEGLCPSPTGVRGALACCSAAKCGGTCGGAGCSDLPGGSELCCPAKIHSIGIRCVAPTDVGCVTVPSVLSDGMVLQAGEPRLWGWSSATPEAASVEICVQDVLAGAAHESCVDAEIDADDTFEVVRGCAITTTRLLRL